VSETFAKMMEEEKLRLLCIQYYGGYVLRKIYTHAPLDFFAKLEVVHPDVCW